MVAIERIPPSALQVIHPFCLTAIVIQTVRAPMHTSYLDIEGLCLSCQRYVSLRIDSLVTRRGGRPPHAHAPVLRRRTWGERV
jgi:hypothetical protein